MAQRAAFRFFALTLNQAHTLMHNSRAVIGQSSGQLQPPTSAAGEPLTPCPTNIVTLEMTNSHSKLLATTPGYSQVLES